MGSSGAAGKRSMGRIINVGISPQIRLAAAVMGIIAVDTA
jgi:hypothetical protein